MRRFYRAILRLYPAEYRVAFAAEMIEVFDEASATARREGFLKVISFGAREFVGLVTGLVSERAAKWSERDAYITARCTSGRKPEFPAEIVDVQRQIEQLIHSMEFAIAHHDFPRARFYSDEERTSRALLQRLLNEQGRNERANS